jgi:hypothetical protein
MQNKSMHRGTRVGTGESGYRISPVNLYCKPIKTKVKHKPVKKESCALEKTNLKHKPAKKAS